MWHLRSDELAVAGLLWGLLSACGDDAPVDEVPSGTSSSGGLSTTSGVSGPGDTTSSSTSGLGSTSADTVQASSSGTGADTTGDSTTTSGGTGATTGDPACGDGVVQRGEACDDRGESASCNADCTAAECGDGIVNGTAGEECEGGPGCSEACVFECPAFASEMFEPAVTFSQGDLTGMPMSIAWDGTHYWAASGGNDAGTRLVQHADDGTMVMAFSPDRDFRALFTMGDGTENVFAREAGASVVLELQAMGAFSEAVQLGDADPPLEVEATVSWNPALERFISPASGVVLQWASDGSFVGTLDLVGYGTEPGELDDPSTVRMSWGRGCYLTYANGQLSSWDHEGARIDTATLEVSVTPQSELTVSYANGLVFIASPINWRGFDVF